MSTKQHWFWGSVANFKSLFVRIGLAAVMINLLSVASSIFIMVVYDRVIPNAAFPSLYALTGGMVVVLIFDFMLKNMRAWFDGEFIEGQIVIQSYEICAIGKITDYIGLSQ